jgi:hypothetical protein
MKALSSSILCLFLSGCASTTTDLYYETAKAISKDTTISQTACWAAVTEIAKSADNTVKMAAISLSDKCKTEPVKLESPKRSIFNF